MSQPRTRPLTAPALAAALALLAALVGAPAPVAADSTTWTVDPAHSAAAFSVRHFFTRVPGRFNDVSGTIVYDPEKPSASSVEIAVEAASIDTNNERRDTHLRSADFFDVEKFPQLVFKSTAVERVDAKNLKVTGNLTIHGVTKEVTVPIEVLGVMGKKAGFSTSFEIDRHTYGIVWNRVVEGGGSILGDDVQIDITIEADLVEAAAEEAAAGGR